MVPHQMYHDNYARDKEALEKRKKTENDITVSVQRQVLHKILNIYQASSGGGQLAIINEAHPVAVPAPQQAPLLAT